MPGIFCVSKPHCIVSGGSQTIRFARDSKYVYPTACEIELECRIKKVLRRFVVAPLLCWQYSTVLRTCQGKNEKFINLKIQRASPFLDTLSVMLELFQTGTEREKMSMIVQMSSKSKIYHRPGCQYLNRIKEGYLTLVELRRKQLENYFPVNVAVSSAKCTGTTNRR